MKGLMRSLRVLWRAEALLTHQRIADLATASWLVAVGVLAGTFGLGMLNLAVFYAVEPQFGQIGSAILVAGIDLTIAAGFVLRARSQARRTEKLALIELRDLALLDLEAEVADLEERFAGARRHTEKLLHHPLDTLAPGVVAALLRSTLEGIRSTEKATS